MLALYTDLDPPKEDPEIVEMREDYHQKSRVRDREKKRLRKMYEMSLTHQASTQRYSGALVYRDGMSVEEIDERRLSPEI